MSQDRETLITVARIAAGSPGLSVWAGDPPVQLHARWVVVSICRDASGKPPQYGVYFLDDSGSIRVARFYESARIALDQAQSMAGTTHLDWLAGEFELPNDGHLDPTEFS